MKRDDPAIQFLLNSSDPSIRHYTLIDLLGQSKRSREVNAARDQILEGPRVKTLLAGQHILPCQIFSQRRKGRGEAKGST